MSVFIEIINKYLYFDLQGLEKAEELQQAIEYLQEKYPEFEKDAQGDQASEAYIKYWNRTKAYINRKINEGAVRISPIE